MNHTDAPKVRVELSMSRQTMELLIQLSSRDGATESQIMSRALALYNVASREAAEGRHLVITDSEFVLLSEIVGIANDRHSGHS